MLYSFLGSADSKYGKLFTDESPCCYILPHLQYQGNFAIINKELSLKLLVENVL